MDDAPDGPVLLTRGPQGPLQGTGVADVGPQPQNAAAPGLLRVAGPVGTGLCLPASEQGHRCREPGREVLGQEPGDAAVSPVIR